jgi:hypothetical protein
VQITVTRETHDKLRRVQDLLRHVVPNGDPAVIFDRLCRGYYRISSGESWRMRIAHALPRWQMLTAVMCRRQ